MSTAIIVTCVVLVTAGLVAVLVARLRRTDVGPEVGGSDTEGDPVLRALAVVRGRYVTLLRDHEVLAEAHRQLDIECAQWRERALRGSPDRDGPGPQGR